MNCSLHQVGGQCYQQYPNCQYLSGIAYGNGTLCVQSQEPAEHAKRDVRQVAKGELAVGFDALVFKSTAVKSYPRCGNSRRTRGTYPDQSSEKSATLKPR